MWEWPKPVLVALLIAVFLLTGVAAWVVTSLIIHT